MGRTAAVRVAVVRAAVARAVAKTAAPHQNHETRLDQQVFPDCFSELFSFRTTAVVAHLGPLTSAALRTHLHVHRDMHAQKMVTVGWVQPLPRVSIGFST